MARISQYLGHGEIRTGKCQDAVSTVTVVLKQASLPEGHGGTQPPAITKEDKHKWKVAGISREAENPDSYVGLSVSGTSPLTQYVKTKPSVVCSMHAGENQFQISQAQSVICAHCKLLTIPKKPEEMTDPGATQEPPSVSESYT